MNLAAHVGDDPAAVAENRRRLRIYLPSEPLWLTQVHGVAVVDATTAPVGVEADAAVAHGKGTVCAVLTADCLPILLCDEGGTVVAAAHAGWRGLAAGVIEAAVRATDTPASRLLAYLGPAIGPQSFEVGPEVRDAFTQCSAEAADAFASRGQGKYLAHLYRLARQRLNALGVTRVFGGGRCTFSEGEHFYSYRRDKATGRMASLIWLE